MLVTNYDQYFDLKLKDLEEIVLNLRLMKEIIIESISQAL